MGVIGFKNYQYLWGSIQDCDTPEYKEREKMRSVMKDVADEYNSLAMSYKLPIYKPIAMLIKSTKVNIPFINYVWQNDEFSKRWSSIDLMSFCYSKGIFCRNTDGPSYEFVNGELKKKQLEDDLLETEDFMLVDSTSVLNHSIYIKTKELPLQDVGLLCYQGTGYLTVEEEEELFKSLSISDKRHLQTMFGEYKIYFIPQMFSCLEFKLNAPKDGLLDIVSTETNQVNRLFSGVLNDAVYKLRRQENASQNLH